MEYQKKKALIVATIGSFLPLFEQNDVKLLQEMNYEVHYAANFEQTFCKEDITIMEQNGIRLHHIGIHRLPTAVFENVRAYRQLKELMTREQFSLIHCHTPLGGVLARLAADRTKTKMIYTAHGFHFYAGAPFHYWLLYFPAEYLLARYTDRLITINQEDFMRAGRFHLKKGGKAELIPGIGIVTEEYKKAPAVREAVRKELGLSEEDFFVLAVGELNANKNHQVLLAAVAELSDKQVFLGICGEGDYRSGLEEQARTLGISERVTLFGFRKDVPELLAAADCLAYPSKREGLGMAALEAMAAGVPVVSSNCRGTREYMRDGVNGFICRENSPGEYAAAIRKLKNDKALCERLSVNCREMAEQFSLSKTEAIMRRIYRECSEDDFFPADSQDGKLLG